jgi:hypothetical protein
MYQVMALPVCIFFFIFLIVFYQPFEILEKEFFFQMKVKSPFARGTTSKIKDLSQQL